MQQGIINKITLATTSLSSTIQPVLFKTLTKNGNSISKIILDISGSTTEGSTASTGLHVWNSIYKIEFKDPTDKVTHTIRGIDLPYLAQILSPKGVYISDSFNGTASTSTSFSSTLELYLPINAKDINSITVYSNTVTGFDPNATSASINLTIQFKWVSDELQTVKIDYLPSLNYIQGDNFLEGDKLGYGLTLKGVAINTASDSTLNYATLTQDNIQYYSQYSAKDFIADDINHFNSGHTAGWFLVYLNTQGQSLVVDTSTQFDINLNTAQVCYAYILHV